MWSWAVRQELTRREVALPVLTPLLILVAVSLSPAAGTGLGVDLQTAAHKADS